ncbi:MAG: CapA family protein [Bacteroidales bacterium]|nr:CapA family protein [Bacteroidales bacterium]MDT8374555.1 CapA family protein [Bacteroidales bacterium]
MTSLKILLPLIGLVLTLATAAQQRDTLLLPPAAEQQRDTMPVPAPGAHEPDTLLPAAPEEQERDSVLTLLFTGDIMGHDGQIASAYDDSTKTWSYDSVFSFVAPLISDADVAIGNLEVTLGGPPYKGYPQFSSPDALAEACRDAGFDILVTANNHAADRGQKGIFRTIRVLDSLGIRHSGTWNSSEERDTLSPLMISHDSITIALLSYTYGTNGIIVPPPATVAYIDTLRATADIAGAEYKGADATVIYVHWGIEYDTLPSARQKLTAAAYLNSGADIVIGSHPHVLQPMIADTGSCTLSKPVVWSMGNFVSNQRARRRDGGAMIRIELALKGDTVVIADAGYVLTWVYTPTEEGKRKYYILPCAEFEDQPEFFQSSSDYDAMMIFVRDARRLLDSLNTGFHEMIWTEGNWIRVERTPVSLN